MSRQDLNEWLRKRVPSERTAAVADRAAATNLLVLHIKRERIPAVVLRAVPDLDGLSVLDLFEQGRMIASLVTSGEN